MRRARDLAWAEAAESGIPVPVAQNGKVVWLDPVTGEELPNFDLDFSLHSLEMLLKYITYGIGPAAGQMLAPWKASRGKESQLIVDKLETESQKMTSEAQVEAQRFLNSSEAANEGTLSIDQDGIKQRFEFQERKRQLNINSVVIEAASQLGGKKVQDHEPDRDWTSRYFGYAQDVSSTFMKSIWSKVLAQEVRFPGQTSLGTLSVLRDLTSRNVEALHRLSVYFIGDFIHSPSYNSTTLYSSFSNVVELEGLGLLNSDIDTAKTLTLDSEGKLFLKNCQGVLQISGEPGKKLNINAIGITRAGRELAQLFYLDTDVEYLHNFKNWLANHNCTLDLVPSTKNFFRGTPSQKQHAPCVAKSPS